MSPAPPSRASLRGLDWFIFCVADVQTGFGPFVSVYLTAQKWTQTDIGLILSLHGLAALLLQVPGGALIDALGKERLLAALAMIAIAASALSFGLWPVFPVVLLANIVHAGASCVLGPAIVAISLGLVGYAAIGERLGRNARFASIGNGFAAAAMGTFGYFYSSRAVFFVTAALLAPTLFALTKIDGKEIISRAPSTPSVPTPSAPEQHKSERRSRRGYSALLIFALCTALFQFANAAMLPLVGSMVTMRSSDWATALIAACIVVPQLVVAVFSPLVGRQAARWGRRPLLLLGYGALVIRGALFTSVANPFLLVAVQVLDGISAAVLGVLVPLIITDVTRETGRLNLTQGAIGTAVGIGASLSTPFAGYLTDRFGSFMAFAGMAASAALGFLLVALLMPETRPK